MSQEKIITVNGFCFYDPKVGEEALKEQEAVEYVDRQLDYADKESLLKLYNSMIARRMFHTQVGISYLKRIQDHLIRLNVDPTTMEAIPIVDVNTDQDNSTKDNSRKERKKSNKKEDTKSDKKNKLLYKKVQKYKTLSISMIVISIVLLLTVVGLFIIQGTSDNPTILNYEEKILDKYASWEEELQQREDAVSIKESSLNIQSKK